MRRRRAFLAGALLLFWANYAAAATTWDLPRFSEPVNKNDNVSWLFSVYEDMGQASLWEGTENNVELMRITYVPEGTEEPTLRYTGPSGLGLEIARDDDVNFPLYVQATEPGNYEGGVSRFTASVSVSSGLTSIVGEVVVILINVNDNPPVISNPTSCAAEEVYTGETNCTFVVTDPDGGACYVQMSVNDNRFSLHATELPREGCESATFIMYIDVELDYETMRLHTLEVTAEDVGQIGEDKYLDGGFTQVQTSSFVLNVIDIPDEPPRWEVMIPSVSVNEKTDWSQQLKAIDGDYGLDWPIVYSLLYPDEEGDDFDYEAHFLINRHTGLLTGKEIDRDALQREIYKFIVVATEVPDEENYPGFEAMSVTNDIVVMVNDINDHDPEIEPTYHEVSHEEEQPFTNRGTFVVTDPDLADNGTFNLWLEENQWSGNFLLIPSSGYQKVDITIAAYDPTLLDYEVPEWREIVLTIISEEVAEKKTRSAILKIVLIDLIDEPPEFEKEEHTVEIEENQEEGFLVVHTIAHDPDEGDVITFSMNNAHMTIDQEGKITTTNPNAFDYERQQEILLQVVAVDTANLKAFCQVNITLIDINDEQPTLILPYLSYDVEEHTAVGERATYDITATDPDTTADLRFQIDWENSAAYSQGVEVQNATLFETSVELAKTIREGSEWTTHLVIADSDEFDWEVFDTLKLQITVIDDATDERYLHKERSTGILTVNVIDINDCYPIFGEYDNLTVTENTEKGRFIGAIIATDDDSPPYSRISYKLEPVYPEELAERLPRLVINPDTGVLSTTDEPIDCDEWQTLVYHYLVFATDGENESNTTVILYIEDDNDVTPNVIEPEGLMANVSLTEHKPGRHELSCIVSEDIDYSPDFHTITYYIIGEAFIYFEMDSPCKTGETCCLWAIEGYDLDREVKDTHVIDIYSRDNYEDRVLYKSNQGNTTTIILTLEDINDNPPVFEDKGRSITVLETNVVIGTELFSAEVTDKDIDENGEILCDEIPIVTSDPERPEGLFIVETHFVEEHTYKCTVIATDSFLDLWGVYTFNLTAQDNGEEPLYGWGDYVLTVENVNRHRPVITYPTNGEIIRLHKDQISNSKRPLEMYNYTLVPNIVAEDRDDPNTFNGQVQFTLTDDSNTFYVDPVSGVINTVLLQMRDVPDKKEFHLTLEARDLPEYNFQTSVPVEFDVYVIDVNSVPVFSESEAIVSFSENATGLTEVQILPAARDYDEELLEEKFRRNIYYYIIDGDIEYFQLNNLTRELTLVKELDFELITEHKITVVTTHNEEEPPSDGYYGNAVLYVTVEVVDINDMPPQFTQSVFPGTFSVDHDVGQKVLEIKAIDPDTEDTITYEMIPDTIEASSDSLQQFANNDAFLVDADTGEVKLNFSPGGRDLDGYFAFGVKAYDSAGDVEGHRDTAMVNVFVVSPAHQVYFSFFNPVGIVEARQDEMAQEFSHVLGYTCTVERVYATTEDEIETSEVLTHFVDDDQKAPVLREVITEEFMKPNTYNALYTSMQELSLTFRGYSAQEPAAEERSYITIVLAAVCAVLAVLVVVFSLAFIVRTRTLNQRLDKLTSKKFGSQDSGLNRDSLAVPGTNRHALEGSNPVWNHDINQSFDNMSQSSGDSDLVGIEDSPEFNGEEPGVDNLAYEPKRSVNPYMGATAPTDQFSSPTYDDIMRRPSINPLAATSAAEGGGFGDLSDNGDFSLEDVGFPRRISLNPLAELDGELEAVDVDVDVDESADADEASGNANFSFQRPGEPSTEL